MRPSLPFFFIIPQIAQISRGFPDYSLCCIFIRLMLYYPGVNSVKKQLSGIFALLGATVIWGSAFIAQSVGMDSIGPFTFQFFRCGLAVLFLFPLSFFMDRKKGTALWKQEWTNPGLWRSGLICGTALFVASSLQQMGLVYTDAGKADSIMRSLHFEKVDLQEDFGGTPLEEMGRKAAELVMEKINNPEMEDRQVVLKTTMRCRESTGE